MSAEAPERRWWKLARCRDTPRGTMFPDLTDKEACVAAVRVCDGCPVVVECGLAGMNEIDGVWGGVLHRPRGQGRRKPRYRQDDETGRVVELMDA